MTQLAVAAMLAAMSRVIGLLAIWGAAVLLAGCAWSGKAPPPKPQAPKHSFKTPRFIVLFKRATGKRLQVDSSSAILSDALSLGPKDPNDPQLGSFVITIVKSGAGAQHLLTDKHEQPLSKSKDGFWWDKQLTSTAQHPKWQATKQYGGNVYLTYFGGNPANRNSLPVTYARLNRVLAGIVKNYG
jgi:hypothetical protein